ncbi:VRR-NUC domain-containing protein [Shinella sp.]|uniref:VRR-NUC domain-containing protein n=1 Tax=Shinella sp. TaxID=1870904 RepID=UPI0028970298|nr:VRR-NUC domain-containing protein [Shinella sp.]
MASSPKSTQTQTTRVNGQRVRIVTRGGKVTVKQAPPKEWEGQAAQVRALRALPEYGKQFLLAGDQNSAKRGPRAQQEAIAAGMTPGEADMRVYLAGGRLRMFENKVGKGRLSPAQVDRHAALARLGHHVEVVRFASVSEAADKAVALVRSWLAANSP